MSKGYKFYYLSHNTRIVESRNAKFLENDLFNGSDQSQSTIFEKDQPFTSSERLVIIHNTPQVQMGVEQPIVEFPQATKNNPVDQIVQEMPEIVEQLIEQQDPQENVDSTLMRSTRARKLAILSDYVMYIQESNYNIEPKMILKRFHKP